jgi:hypothetical protein
MAQSKKVGLVTANIDVLATFEKRSTLKGPADRLCLDSYPRYSHNFFYSNATPAEGYRVRLKDAVRAELVLVRAAIGVGFRKWEA